MKSKLILLLIAATYIIIAAQSAGEPFFLDEAAFVHAAEAVTEKGVPRFYDGELMSDTYGLWHPPTYIYTLALSFAFFGASEVSARAVGMAFTLSILLVVYLTAKEVFKNDRNREIIGLTSAAIYAVSPLVIKGSLLVDIDGTLLSFTTALFAYFYVRFHDTLTAKRKLLLALLFAAIIWSKFQGAIVVAPTLLLFSILRKGARKNITDSLEIITSGTLLFATSWLAFTALLHLPFANPFSHSFGAILGKELNVLPTLFLMAWSVKNVIFWTTPAFILLVTIALLKRMRSYAQKKAATGYDFLLIYGLMTFAFFTIFQQTAYGFPKYFTAMMPVLAVVSGTVSANFLLRAQKPLLPLAAFGIISAAYVAFALKDPFVQHNIFYTTTVTLAQNLATYVNTSAAGLILYVLPLIFGTLIFLLARQKPYNAVMLTAITFLAVGSLYVDAVQATAEYSTIYAYGQRGMKEAAEYVRQQTGEGEIIISRADIAHYAGRRYFMSYPTRPYFNKHFREISGRDDIRYIVISPSEKLPELAGYELETEFGHFKIYRKGK